MGIVLAVGGLLNRTLDYRAPIHELTAVLAAMGAGLIVWGRMARRFGILACGVLAVYAAASRVVVRGLGHNDTGIAFWIVVSSIAVVAILLILHQRWSDGDAR